MSTIHHVTRREFLAATGLAGAGLILGVSWPRRVAADPVATSAPGLSPNVFLHVAPDGQVTIWVSRSEMGQGVRTGLPAIVAEELDVPWESVGIEQAPGALDGRYGPQLTGGSLSVRQMYAPLRRAGAVGRAMVVAAAALEWGVSAGDCHTEKGEVIHPSGSQRIKYGALAEAAASLDVPDEDAVPLKDPSQFGLIGTRIHRTDDHDHTHGHAVFGSDVRVPGMRYAAVKRCPIYGGSLRRYDASRAMQVPGVRQVIEYEGNQGPFYIAQGLAVVADNTWAALRGMDQLEVEWDEGPTADASTDALATRFRELAREAGEVQRNDGDVDEAFANASNILEAAYEVPFLAHATMEPMTCTVRVDSDACEMWTPTQDPQGAQEVVARYLGLPPEKVTVHVPLMGGGFGRRLYNDMELEAAGIARQVDGPVKVVWTREDDIRHDRYRPASYHVLRGAIDGRGRPAAWSWHILNTYLGRFDPDDFPAYAVPNYRVHYTHVPFVLPRGAWRATVNSYNPFVVQSFFDEMAHAAEADPLQFRLDAVRASTRERTDEVGYDRDRMLRVIETAADKAGWGSPLPQGVGRGVSFHAGYGSCAAEVAEVEVVDGRPKVRRVVCAVDCGQVINPDLVEAQCEGAVTFALSAALKQRITVARGRVQETNFSDFPLLTFSEMPQIEAHIIESHATPGGMGEVPLPPLFAAVTNAIYDAANIRVRKLPIGPLKLK